MSETETDVVREVTVRELIVKLMKLNPDLPVFTSTDDEGNGYRPVYEDWVNEEAYEDQDGEIVVGISELTPELMKQGYELEDVMPNKCVIIG